MAFTFSHLTPRVFMANALPNVDPEGNIEQKGAVTFGHFDITEYEQAPAGIITAAELQLHRVYGGIVSSAENNDSYHSLATFAPFTQALFVAFRQNNDMEAANGTDIGVVSILAWGEMRRTSDNVSP